MNAPSVYDRNRALASHDITHNFQVGFVYELPFGDGKPYATSGLSRTILGGWQMNGTFSAYSGRPFTLTASGASLNMPANQQTPDQIKDNVEIFGEVGDAGTYVDTTAFARVTGEIRERRPEHHARPCQQNLDLSLFRSFHLSGTADLQFRNADERFRAEMSYSGTFAER